MGKLHFRFGAMGSSKTAQALIMKFNYEEKNLKVFFGKPATDTRDGADVVRSRIGLSAKVEVIPKDLDLYKRVSFEIDDIDIVIIDEAQFLTPRQIEDCRRLVDTFDIPVFLYGLRTDFQSHLFEGSKRIMELADEITQLKTVCSCGREAIINARLVNGKPVNEGETIQLGGNESYVAMCHNCWERALKWPTKDL